MPRFVRAKTCFFGIILCTTLDGFHMFRQIVETVEDMFTYTALDGIHMYVCMFRQIAGLVEVLFTYTYIWPITPAAVVISHMYYISGFRQIAGTVVDFFPYTTIAGFICSDRE